MEYKSQTNRHKRIFQPKTRKTVPEYKLRTQKDGTKKLVKVDEYDIYEKIQQNKDTYNLKKLVELYQIKPDESINKLEENVADLTRMPTNLIEAQKQAEEARIIFDSLSVKVKNKFDNDFGKFLAASTNGELKKVIEEHNKSKNVLENQVTIEEAQKQAVKTTEETKQTTGGIKYE